jgi:hypothetical protein
MLSFISSILALVALSSMSVPAVNAQLTCPSAGSTAGSYAVSPDGLYCKITCNTGYQLTPDQQYCIPSCSGDLSPDGLICTRGGIKHYLNPQITAWQTTLAYQCVYVKYMWEKMGGSTATYSSASSYSCCSNNGISCTTGTSGIVTAISWASRFSQKTIHPTLGYLTSVTDMYIYD